MSIPKTDHIFAQADRLISNPGGPARQADLRRALSSAYYGLFHFTMSRIADEFVGSTQRSSGIYALFYRSVDHRQLRQTCSEVLRKQPTQKYTSYIPPEGWSADIRAFAAALIDLQEKRSDADYDPRARFNSAEAQLAVDTARRALQLFQKISAGERKAFLTLLVCPPR